MIRITSFDGANRFLSNFYPSPVTLAETTYPTVEHAYQASKTLDIEARRKIAAVKNPGHAKRMGKFVKWRPDWVKCKLPMMRALVMQKFSTHASLRKMLLDTGDAELIEGNTWGDTFWGVCDGRGENHLGKILMDVRKTLREEDEL